jgi:hypothetical protein
MAVSAYSINKAVLIKIGHTARELETLDLITLEFLRSPDPT